MPPEFQKPSRIEIVDILRGFALLGIAMVHFVEQYYAGQAPEVHADMVAKSLGDQIVTGIIGTFVQGKFYMIFSFLFGLSFFIQLEKSDGSAGFVIRFSWRLIILFLIGALHQLHYRGDILTIYAVLGFVLLLLHRLPDKALLVVALVLIADIPSFGLRLYDGISNTTKDYFNSDQATLLTYYDTMKSGDYQSIVKANWKDMSSKVEFQFSSGRAFITTGLFLLGLWVGRKRFFEDWQVHVPALKRLMKISLWTLAGCVIFSVVVFGGIQVSGIQLSQSFMYAIGGLPLDVANASLATIYVLGIMLLYQKENWRKRLGALYSPGRMGLTTYLVQGLIGVLIFSAIGLGMLGDFGATITLPIGISVFILQVYFSKWWLSHFQYGLFEWLWRSATYLKWQPFRRRPVETQLSTDFSRS
jgi:uncharacterized protein